MGPKRQLLVIALLTCIASLLLGLKPPAGAFDTSPSPIPGPDLIVESISPPSAAQPGSVIQVWNSIKNQGTDPAGPSVVKFYLSTDRTITGADTYLGSRSIGGLAPNASDTLTTSLTITPGTPLGSYYLGAIADADNQVAEGDETNNTGYARIDIVQPDLIVQSIDAPDSAQPGQGFIVPSIIRNQGGLDAGSFRVRFYLSPDPIITTSDIPLRMWGFGRLGAGISHRIDPTLYIPVDISLGNYYLGAIADADGEVVESNEGNNTNYDRISIVQPDLIVQSISAPTSTQPCQTIAVTTTIRNQGNGAAAASVVKFYLSPDPTISSGDTYLGSWAIIPGLAAGASTTVGVNLLITCGVTLGDYYLGAIADVNNWVVESNEANNTNYAPITIVRPDLIVQSIDAPASARPGQSIAVTNTIRNQGTASTGSFVVKFYLSPDPTISSGDTYLGSRTIASLAAGASNSAVISLTLPSSLAGGTWYVGAIADANYQVLESNEANNTGYDRIIIIVQPDLIVQSITAPASAQPGQTIAVANTIRNQGTGNAGGFVVKFYQSPDPFISSGDFYLGSRTIASLAAGASNSAVISLTLRLNLRGTWYVGAIADANNQVVESNEANNTGYDSINIVQPDLIVQSISAPASAQPGQTIAVANTIRNQGTGNAGTFVVKFYLSSNPIISSADTYLGIRSIGSLGAGFSSSAVTNLTLPLNLAGGTWYLGAIADATNLVAESNEANNTGYDAITIIAPLYLSLSIEDAPEGVPVNMVAGDSDGAASQTYVEIVARLLSYSSASASNISVILTIPGNVFGAPVNAWVRDTAGGALTPVSYTSLGGGQYRVTTNLSPFLWWFRKQIVWRFAIPNSISPQVVGVYAQLQVPSIDPFGSGTIRILAPGQVRAIIVANRKRLYDQYIDSEVTNLLNRLFVEAQGPPASNSPRGVIYYVDRYSTLAYNWNNAAINYTSSATANQTANAIDSLIEDWQEDGISYASIYIPFIGYIYYPVAWPQYLLIAGDDNTIPFHRYDDPSNDEGINLFNCDAAPGNEHPGWCVDSATNPAVRATDQDYILTDNPYAALGATDWQRGDQDLWVGRLLGASAADMLSLLREGVSWTNGRRGSVVMASVDGWELGLQPHQAGPGNIADLYDVPALFRGKGFAVRNDDIPATEVRTIDVMPPYEGGDASWNTNWRAAANNAAGMDLFFIGGHDSYDHAVIPGDDFSPDDTCAAAACAYNRFDNDHPIVMIVGCHGGLPVPNVDVPGGPNSSMVYDVIREGARAYIGATGFSYGSPNNLHRATWGERLIQAFFGKLLQPTGSNSMAIGKALAEAKTGYVFGFGANDALDRKTVTEFNLYGVPWAFIFYPAGGGAALEAGAPQERAFSVRSGPVIRIADTGVYTRTFTVDIITYTVGTEIQDSITYHLLSITGGNLAIANGAPILPYLEGYTMTLPFSGTVTNVQVVGVLTSSVGPYTIPTAIVGPLEQGLSYTTTSAITTPYPVDADLVQYQQTGQGVLFIIFPIQFNPATRETTFYRHFEVRVTYQSPLALNVSSFSTDKARYAPGETISTTTGIENVGDVTATLTATLTIRDNLGQVVGTQSADQFTVPSGGSYVLPLSWTGTLTDGTYIVEVSLWSEGSFVGGGSAGVSMVSGEITSLAAPARVRPWEEGTFQVSFANYSGVTTTAEVSLTIRAAEGGFAERMAPQVITVGNGLTATATFTWTPAGVSGGNYNAVAIVVSGSQTYGPASRAFQVESIADLTVQEVNVPASVLLGETVTVTYRIANRGNIEAENFTVGFYFSPDEVISATDTLLGAQSIVSLTAGASLWEEIPLTIPTGITLGQYYLGAIADAGQSVTETNEANNILYDGLALSGQPDLVVTSIDAPTSAQVGAVVSVVAVIANQGTDSAGSSEVEFYLSTDEVISTTDRYLGSQSIGSLAVGALVTITTNLTIPTDITPTSYYLGAIADADSQVAESDESNNTLSRSISIQGLADLVVETIQVPAPVWPGTTVPVANTILNQGSAAAGSFEVRFYLSADTTITTADAYLGSRTIGSLTVGASDTETTNLTIPADLGSGQYYLGAIADAGESVSELDETNNTNSSELVQVYLGHMPSVMKGYRPGPEEVTHYLYLPSTMRNYQEAGEQVFYYLYLPTMEKEHRP